MILIVLLFLLLFSPEVQAASGCNYPTTLDSYANKTTGDFLTVADVNSRSCAIEQLELRLNQIIGGKSGGQGIIGGTGASQNLNLSSTSHATKGFIVFGAVSAFDENATRLGIGTVTPSRKIHTVGTAGGATMLLQVNTDTSGPTIELLHNGSFSNVANINFLAVDSGATTRVVSQISTTYLDATTASQDSQMNFCVQNNVNATNCNTTATLSSLGVWTDSSSGVNKDYEGDLQPGEAIQKLKQLNMGVYRAKGLSSDKISKAERHYSPTSEDFYQVFGFGSDTGIAPKDAAFIAAKAVLELEARVQALEKVAP